MTDTLEPLRKVAIEMSHFARQAAEETFPASALSLTAVRKTKPALAKLIFSQAVIAPAWELLTKYGCADEAFRKLEELESRFLQEPVGDAIYAVELLVASRLVARMYDLYSPDYERFCLEPITDEQGRLYGGIQLLRWLVRDLCQMLGQAANSRERRVQLLLAGAAAGPVALDAALKEAASDHKGAVLESVYQWLLLNGVEDAERRRKLTDFIAKHSDERIDHFLSELLGCTSQTDERVRILVDEIFTGERYIEF